VGTRNVTLTLPDDLLRRLKVIAAQRDSSISAMLVQALEQVADDETGFANARRGMLRDLKKGYNLRTNGKIGWSRDSIHER
jgi:predicted transcriptional regulator